MAEGSTGEDGSARLRFTGHALVDVGIAGLCAFARRKHPEELKLTDLDGASEWLTKTYYEGRLNAYLSCVFMNASFVQPNEGPDKRETFKQQYLAAHRAPVHPDVAGMSCVFSREAATSPLVRTHFPLFSGEGVLNFRPNGTTSIPVAGPYVLAIMFLPMACRRSEGRLLAVHADAPALTLGFARQYLEDNRKLLALPLPEARAIVHPAFEREQPMWDATKKRNKYPDVKGPRSLVVSDLGTLAAKVELTNELDAPTALHAYLVSNSGQGPSLDVFQVPSGVAAFVLKATGAPTATAWKAVSSRFQPLSEPNDDDAKKPGKKPSGKRREAIAGRPGWSRNWAFEELCDIFDAGFTDRGRAAAWLRRHILGRIEYKSNKPSYRDGGARQWALAALFLREVLGMNDGRIKAIRGYADKLATWICEKRDKKLLNAILFEKLSELDHRLRAAQLASAKGTLLFGLDEHRNVWLHEDGDRYLVRDLISIRVVEVLHEAKWFAENPEIVVDQDAATDAAAPEEIRA
jgi:CRISPR-associated protein Cst1